MAISEIGPDENPHEKVYKVLELRQRIVGVMLRKSREDQGMTQKELSQKTGISTGKISKYESGEQSIPLPELEALLHALGRSLQEFNDSHGPVGHWLRERNAIDQLLDMPSDLQEFVCKPFNRPYLEIAKTLSDMDVDRLRAVAEGLLDITL